MSRSPFPLTTPVRSSPADGAAFAPGLVTLPLSPELVALASDGGAEALRARSIVTWERPDRGEALFGVGEALRITGDPGAPLAAASRCLRAVARGARVDAGVAREARPRFFGGARFDATSPQVDPDWDPFGSWQFVVPRFLIVATPDGYRGSVTLPASAPAGAAAIEGELRAAIRAGSRVAHNAAVTNGTRHPAVSTQHSAGAGLDPAAWRDAVAAAVAEIDAGRYEKLVLARQVRRAIDCSPDEIAGRLVAAYPRCFVFSLRAGGSTWLGASPELLVRYEDGTVFTGSLAGSRPRDAAAEADCHARAFLHDPKIRHEHDIVVAAIRDAIAPACVSLIVPGEPALMRLPNIDHLYTPIRGEALPGVDVLDLVGRLHPTPAVGGWPREDALAALDRLEQMDRGWYAAPIGWMDFAGDGEFAVGLRSALVTGSCARLYAGAGIVAGSVPQAELEETEAKLAPVLQALA